MWTVCLGQWIKYFRNTTERKDIVMADTYQLSLAKLTNLELVPRCEHSTCSSCMSVVSLCYSDCYIHLILVINIRPFHCQR